MPSADKNKVNWGSNKHKNPKKKDTADEVKRAGKVKKHKADTTANEVKQNTRKKKKCKATTTAYEDNLVLSEQADGSKFVSVDGSDSSDDSGSLSFHNDSDNISGDESDKTSQSDDQNVVYADFEFFDPKQDDFHGLKSLLTTYCDGKEWDLSGFIDIILAQTTVGTVIKTDGDCLFGVITAINLARYKDQCCIMELRNFLLDKSFEKAEAVQLKTLWEKHPHDVGLLVCERVVNLPFELIPPLYDGLFDEVSWAVEDEPTQELRDSFQFKHYLLLTRVYQTIPKECKVAKREKKKRKKGSLQNGDDQNDDKELIYIKPEDEILHQLCSWSFTFPVHADYLATHEVEDVKPMRLLMAVKVENIQTFRAQLKALLDEC